MPFTPSWQEVQPAGESLQGRLDTVVQRIPEQVKQRGLNLKTEWNIIKWILNGKPDLFPQRVRHSANHFNNPVFNDSEDRSLVTALFSFYPSELLKPFNQGFHLFHLP